MKTARKYRPGVEIGDRVYFRCAEDGPRSGSVVSRGKHGCTVDCEGGQHRVRWGDLLGHKKRTNLRYTILDEGEDGVIVEDEHGQRRYLSIPPGQREDPLVMKAFDGRYLFLKAKGTEFMGRPGLSKKRITDKLGRSTTRWVRTQQDEPTQRKQAAADDGARTSRAGADQPRPEYKAGQRVSFRSGGTSGEGEIIGTPGADGAHVKDSSGRTHQVRYSEITQTGSSNDAQSAEISGGLKPFFDDALIKDLPDPKDYRHDAFSSWEEAAKMAPEAHAQYHSILKGLASKLGLDESSGSPGSMTPEMIDSEQSYLFMGPIKKQDKSTKKVENDYDGDWGRLKDVVRATIAVKGVDDVRKILSGLGEAGMRMAQRPKDNMTHGTADGYRDINMILFAPNGMPVELQIQVKAITKAKAEGHDYYNANIVLEQKNKGNRDIETWSEEDRFAFQQNREKQREVYGRAWAVATGATKRATEGKQSSAVLPQQTLRKAGLSNIIIIVKEVKK